MSSAVQLALVGRDFELLRIRACVEAERNVLLEGPVGVGKTHLALAITQELGRKVLRVDGDGRYSEQKLTGWFDPPTVLKKGFTAESFIPGPLVEAMQAGGVLFINELNRLPEGVQNVLLPAIDERRIQVPRLGEIVAKSGFVVIATQNPKEFVATSHLSEAILDRFELVIVPYQTVEEEIQIVRDRLGTLLNGSKIEVFLPTAAVRLIRLTRDHPKVRRGASIRAALSIAEISLKLIAKGQLFEEAFLTSALLALPTRIELERELESDSSSHEETKRLFSEWVRTILDELQDGSVKKKS